MNHFKDEEDDFEKTKLLCRFVNPQAASIFWDKKETETTISTESLLYNQMAKDLKHKYTPQELEAFMSDPKHYAELDVIKGA
ncbi:MAG: hypothetical protein ACREBR_05630 [bacterium]